MAQRNPRRSSILKSRNSIGILDETKPVDLNSDDNTQNIKTDLRVSTTKRRVSFSSKPEIRVIPNLTADPYTDNTTLGSVDMEMSCSFGIPDELRPLELYSDYSAQNMVETDLEVTTTKRRGNFPSKPEIMIISNLTTDSHTDNTILGSVDMEMSCSSGIPHKVRAVELYSDHSTQNMDEIDLGVSTTKERYSLSSKPEIKGNPNLSLHPPTDNTILGSVDMEMSCSSGTPHKVRAVELYSDHSAQNMDEIDLGVSTTKERYSLSSKPEIKEIPNLKLHPPTENTILGSVDMEMSCSFGIPQKLRHIELNSNHSARNMIATDLEVSTTKRIGNLSSKPEMKEIPNLKLHPPTENTILGSVDMDMSCSFGIPQKLRPLELNSNHSARNMIATDLEVSTTKRTGNLSSKPEIKGIPTLPLHAHTDNTILGGVDMEMSCSFGIPDELRALELYSDHSDQNMIETDLGVSITKGRGSFSSKPEINVIPNLTLDLHTTNTSFGSMVTDKCCSFRIPIPDELRPLELSSHITQTIVGTNVGISTNKRRGSFSSTSEISVIPNQTPDASINNTILENVDVEMCSSENPKETRPLPLYTRDDSRVAFPTQNHPTIVVSYGHRQISIPNPTEFKNPNILLRNPNPMNQQPSLRGRACPFNQSGYYGLFGSAKTPVKVLEGYRGQLNQRFKQALKTTEVQTSPNLFIFGNKTSVMSSTGTETNGVEGVSIGTYVNPSYLDHTDQTFTVTPPRSVRYREERISLNTTMENGILEISNPLVSEEENENSKCGIETAETEGGNPLISGEDDEDSKSRTETKETEDDNSPISEQQYEDSESGTTGTETETEGEDKHQRQQQGGLDLNPNRTWIEEIGLGPNITYYLNNFKELRGMDKILAYEDLIEEILPLGREEFEKLNQNLQKYDVLPADYLRILKVKFEYKKIEETPLTERCEINVGFQQELEKGFGPPKKFEKITPGLLKRIAEYKFFL